MNEAATIANIYSLSALVVATVVSPLILAMITGYQRRADKAEDYKRQDAVAAQAAEAARLLVSDNRRVAEAAAHASEAAIGKLDVIHTLVNSNLTAALQAQLDATMMSLEDKRQIMTLRPRTPQDDAAIDALKAKIAELRKTLAERLVSSSTAAKQIDIRASEIAQQ